MGYSYKPDHNQAGIVKELTNGSVGDIYEVIVMAAAGNGFPDIYIPHNGFNFLFEIKPDDTPWVLTSAQKKLHPILQKNGQIEIAFTAQQIHNYIKDFKCPFCARKLSNEN